MSELPSTHGANGKNGNGRFKAGNKLGRGNPLAGRAAKIRAVLLKRMTPKDAAAIADTLIAQAKRGDLPSIRELLDRTIGRPVQSDVLQRLEELETQVFDRPNNEEAK